MVWAYKIPLPNSFVKIHPVLSYLSSKRPARCGTEYSFCPSVLQSLKGYLEILILDDRPRKKQKDQSPRHLFAIYSLHPRSSCARCSNMYLVFGSSCSNSCTHENSPLPIPEDRNPSPSIDVASRPQPRHEQVKAEICHDGKSRVATSDMDPCCCTFQSVRLKPRHT